MPVYPERIHHLLFCHELHEFRISCHPVALVCLEKGVFSVCFPQHSLNFEVRHAADHIVRHGRLSPESKVPVVDSTDASLYFLDRQLLLRSRMASFWHFCWNIRLLYSLRSKFAAARLSWPDPTAAPLPADRTAGNCAVSSPGPGTHSPIPHQIHKYKED